MTEGNHKKNPNQFDYHQNLNVGLSEHKSSVVNFDQCSALCIQKLDDRPYFTVGRRWNKSLNLQPLQRCSCENSEVPCACVMRRHYSVMHMQSLHTISGLLAVGQVGNLLCEHHSYVDSTKVIQKITTVCTFPPRS